MWIDFWITDSIEFEKVIKNIFLIRRKSVSKFEIKENELLQVQNILENDCSRIQEVQ